MQQKCWISVSGQSKDVTRNTLVGRALIITKQRKKACISFYSFCRIWTFQWVVGKKGKKIARRSTRLPGCAPGSRGMMASFEALRHVAPGRTGCGPRVRSFLLLRDDKLRSGKTQENSSGATYRRGNQGIIGSRFVPWIAASPLPSKTGVFRRPVACDDGSIEFKIPL
jgi:hypothetical protein